MYWFPVKFKNRQPDGTYWASSWDPVDWSNESHVERKHTGYVLNAYIPKDTPPRLGSRQVVLIVGSVTIQFAKIVDPKLLDTPPDDHHKHSNYTLDAGMNSSPIGPS